MDNNGHWDDNFHPIDMFILTGEKMEEREYEPRKVKMFRLTPQLKTFKNGTLLKTKQDLYYSLEEDIVETGGEDNSNAFSLIGGAGAGNSFSMSDQFFHKDMTVMFVEAAQFRADDGYVYVRGHLLSEGRAAWVNILRIPQRKWGYMIRMEQKTKIKEEIEKMFEVLAE